MAQLMDHIRDFARSIKEMCNNHKRTTVQSMTLQVMANWMISQVIFLLSPGLIPTLRHRQPLTPALLCVQKSSARHDRVPAIRTVNNPEARATISRLPVTVRSSSLPSNLASNTGSNLQTRVPVHPKQPAYRSGLPIPVDATVVQLRAANDSQASSSQSQVEVSTGSSQPPSRLLVSSKISAQERTTIIGNRRTLVQTKLPFRPLQLVSQSLEDPTTASSQNIATNSEHASSPRHPILHGLSSMNILISAIDSNDAADAPSGNHRATRSNETSTNIATNNSESTSRQHAESSGPSRSSTSRPATRSNAANAVKSASNMASTGRRHVRGVGVVRSSTNHRVARNGTGTSTSTATITSRSRQNTQNVGTSQSSTNNQATRGNVTRGNDQISSLASASHQNARNIAPNQSSTSRHSTRNDGPSSSIPVRRSSARADVSSDTTGNEVPGLLLPERRAVANSEALIVRVLPESSNTGMASRTHEVEERLPRTPLESTVLENGYRHTRVHDMTRIPIGELLQTRPTMSQASHGRPAQGLRRSRAYFNLPTIDDEINNPIDPRDFTVIGNNVHYVPINRDPGPRGERAPPPSIPAAGIHGSNRQPMNHEERSVYEKRLKYIRIILDPVSNTYPTANECFCFDVGREHEPVMMPTCTHVFGRKCITGWLMENNSCPNCRVRIPLPSKEDPRKPREN